MKRTASAPGKIILSGEYAVVFGYPGIAVPATFLVKTTWEDSADAPMKIVLEGLTGEESYARRIVDACAQGGGPTNGTLTIDNQIPVGRGMGSSTALVIAVCTCLLGEERERALRIEEAINPGHSGLDFAVIWTNQPVLFRKGSLPERIELSLDFLKNSRLIDTGKPGETTAALVAWMRGREAEVTPHLKNIGECTERLIAGEDPKIVIRDHHRAQVALGIVPPSVQKLIEELETKGGAAKVLGAGARTRLRPPRADFGGQAGGGGMVLVLE